MTKKKQNKNSDSPAGSPVLGAKSAEPPLDPASWLDGLQGEDLRLAQSLGCCSIEDLERAKAKKAEAEKKAAKAQKEQIERNEANARWEKKPAGREAARRSQVGAGDREDQATSLQRRGFGS